MTAAQDGGARGPGVRPAVRVVLASSLDGKLSTVGRAPVTWTSRADRARLFERRDAADALLVGAATLRAEDPPLLPSAERRAARVARGLPACPLRAVVSATLDLPLGRALKVEPGAPIVVFTGPATPESQAREAPLVAHGAEVVRLPAMPASGIDLCAALDHLASRGAREVCCEGGGALIAAMLEQDLVDEVHLTICPVILGGATAPTPVDGAGLVVPRRARLVSSQVVGEELFLVYSLRG